MFGKAIWDKLPEGNFKIFKNDEVDLSQKFHKSNMWLLVTYTKQRKRGGNYKNNTVNSAVSITINRVIN